MANVMLTLLHRLGLDDMQSFGDSTGEFSFAAAETTVAGNACSLREKPRCRIDHRSPGSF